MSHILGQQDTDLHHEDGSHRTTAADTSGQATSLHERRIRRHLQAHETGIVNEDPDGLDCYSDHAHDIWSTGSCMFCGSDEVTVIGHILPDVERFKGITDPVKMAAIVVNTKSATMFDGVLLDHYSASAIQAVYDALSTPEAREKLRAIPLVQAVPVCFKLINQQRQA